MIFLGRHCAIRKGRLDKPNSFEIITEERIYSLYADDANDMNDWISHLQKAIDNESTGKSQVAVPTTTIRVKGMVCDKCAQQVRKVVDRVVVSNFLQKSF